MNSTLFAGDTLSCTFKADDGVHHVEVPANVYGVFRTYTRGNANLENGDAYSFTATYGSDAQTRVISGPKDLEDFTYTNSFAVAPTGSAKTFDGQYALDLGGTSGLSSEVDVDSIDLLVAYTTLAEQETSLVTIGIQQLAISTHLDETAGLLTNSNGPPEGGNSVTLIGGAGSATLGFAARYNLADGFSLLGGASIIDFGVPGGGARGLLAAGAVRFVQPGASEMRLMGEVGVRVAGLGLSFSRHYADGFQGTDASGNGTGLLSSAYIRGGVLWAPDADNSVLFTGTLKQGVLGVGSFVEDDPDTNPNLFGANLSGTSDNFTTVKGEADWTRKLGPGVDMTTSLALGAAYGSGASADIFAVGAVNGGPVSTVFAQYGLRVGWDLGPSIRVDGFLAGSTGTNIGTHAQVGAEYHMSF